MRAEFAFAVASVLRPWWRARQIRAAYHCLCDADTIQRELDDLKLLIGKTPPEGTKVQLLNAKREVYEHILGIER